MATHNVIPIWVFAALESRNDVADPDREKHTTSIGFLLIAWHLDSHAAFAGCGIFQELLFEPISCCSNASFRVGLAGEGVPGAKGGQF
jgi:hypothetical protein